MWIFYISLALLILLTGYFFVFPLHKKRPVLIRSGGLIVYVVMFALFFYEFLGIWILIPATIITLFIILLKPWFVYGVKRDMIFEALQKASIATRATTEKFTYGYIIDSNMRVRPYELMGLVGIILFGVGKKSKKARLTAVVFRKFIQNYFV